jgi:hypothetical protein
MGMFQRHSRALALVYLTSILGGCASARLILEQPVADQCTSAGLEGCPALTEGVVLYVEGNAAEGSAKIQEGARANEPAKLREFASTLEKLTSLPGVSSYAGTIHAVAAVLADSAKPRAAVAAKAASVHAKAAETEPEHRSPRAPVPEETMNGVVPLKVDLSESPDTLSQAVASPPPVRIEGGTILPMAETGAVPCRVGAPIGATMLCLTAATGPFVLTDLHASGECRSDLLIVAGVPDLPRWTLSVPMRTAVHITGARLFAGVGQPIAVAVSEKAHLDARCAVTWSGSRP